MNQNVKVEGFVMALFVLPFFVLVILLVESGLKKDEPWPWLEKVSEKWNQAFGGDAP